LIFGADSSGTITMADLSKKGTLNYVTPSEAKGAPLLFS